MTRPSAPDMSPAAIAERLRAMGDLFTLGMSLRTARPLGPAAALPRDEDGRPILEETLWNPPGGDGEPRRYRLRRLGDGSAQVLDPAGSTHAFADPAAAIEFLTARSCQPADPSPAS